VGRGRKEVVGPRHKVSTNSLSFRCPSRIANSERDAFTRGEYCSVSRELFSSSGTGEGPIVNEPTFHRTRAMSFPRCNNYCGVPFCEIVCSYSNSARIFRVRNKNRCFTTVHADSTMFSRFHHHTRSIRNLITNFVATFVATKIKFDSRLHSPDQDSFAVSRDYLFARGSLWHCFVDDFSLLEGEISG